jgi:hypothetical protein
MGGYWLAGLWTPAVTRDYWVSLPAVLAAIFLGRAINQRMRSRRFILYIHAGLALIAAVLIFKALAGSGAIFRQKAW